MTGEGLQILTYARHSWPLSSEGSLACHTYCDTGHPFIMVNYLFYLGLSRLGFEHRVRKVYSIILEKSCLYPIIALLSDGLFG